MLTRVTPVEFTRSVASGRTGPSLLVCEKPDGSTVELIAKFSAGCDEREVNLSREVIGACLAADLGLPVPEPFLIEIPEDWIEIIPDAAYREKIRRSSRVAFGSKFITGQFASWTIGNSISQAMAPQAASIFAFDAIVQNPDRRDGNSNCLVRGDELMIIDHELAFSHGLVIGWRPPWAVGGLRALETSGFHIFRAGLRNHAIDFVAIGDRWKALSDADIASYETAVPHEWNGVSNAIRSALSLIKDARDNIKDCLVEIRRVLS